MGRSGSGRCFPVFPKGPAPAAQRGVWHPSGLSALGAKGCVRSAQGAKAVVGRLLVYRRRQYYKTIQPPCGRGNAPLLVAGATTLPGGKHVTGFSGRFRSLTARLSPTYWILRSLSLPYESSSFATLKGTQDVTCFPLVSPVLQDGMRLPPSFGRQKPCRGLLSRALI